MRAAAWIGAGLFAAALGTLALQHTLVWGRPAGAGTSVTLDALLNLALFSGFATHHSLLARPAVKRRLGLSPELERIAYVWTASLLLLPIVVLLWRPLPGIAWQAEGLARLLLHGVQLVGLGITVVAASRLDVRDLAGLRPSRQRGGEGISGPVGGKAASGEQPAPEAGGVYRWVRHPIYLGWILLVVGPPTMTATRLLWAAASTAYLVVAIPLEERSLAAEFGHAYGEYQRQVRWRLLPGVW